MAEVDAARKGEPEDEAEKPDESQDTTDWKAEARKWEKRAKESLAEAKANAEAAKKLRDLEDADKSEIEKAVKRAEEAEKRATEQEARALRLEIAHEKGLTPSQAKRLVGASREELEADAEELLSAFKPVDNGDLPRRPKEKLRPGASADAEPEPSGEEIAEKILKTTY